MVVEIAGMICLAQNLTFAAICSSCPGEDAEACGKSGRLYPWHVAMTACPAGWHLSTEEEWRRLERSLGMAEAEIMAERLRGPGLGEMLKPGGTARLDVPLAGCRRPDGSYSVGNGTTSRPRCGPPPGRTTRRRGTATCSSARTGI